MSYYRTVPNFKQQIISKNGNDVSWFRYLSDTDQGIPPSNEVEVAVSASPFMYTAPRGGFVIIDGGVVSSIAFTRTSTYITGLLKGTIPVSLGDRLKITYSAKPTMTFVPT